MSYIVICRNKKNPLRYRRGFKFIKALSLLSFQLEHDRLFLVRFHLTPVLYGRCPLTTLLDYTDRFVAKTAFRRTVDRLYVTHIPFPVHNELYHDGTLDFIVDVFVCVTYVLVPTTLPHGSPTMLFQLSFT